MFIKVVIYLLLPSTERQSCFCLLLLLRPGRGAEYCDQPVCLSVCVSVSASVYPRAYLWNRWTDHHEILYASPLWRGSVFLWRRCDALCTSGFMDDAMFGRNGPYGDSGVAIPGQSLMSMNASFFIKCQLRVVMQYSSSLVVHLLSELQSSAMSPESFIMHCTSQCPADSTIPTTRRPIIQGIILLHCRPTSAVLLCVNVPDAQ